MPFLLIILGTTMFLAGAVVLPFMTVATQLDITERHAFEVPGIYQIQVEAPTTLGLYDLSVRRPDKPILWDKSHLRNILYLTEIESGERVPLIGKGDSSIEEENKIILGFFTVPSAGSWILIAPEEVLPEDISEGVISWTLREPPNQTSQALGSVYISIAVLGAIISSTGLFLLICPRKRSRQL